MLVYTRATPDFSDIVLVAANFDLYGHQTGNFEVDLPNAGGLEMRTLLGDGLHWEGGRGKVELDPANGPVVIAALQATPPVQA